MERASPGNNDAYSPPSDSLPSESSGTSESDTSAPDTPSSGNGLGIRKALRDIAPYLDLGWRLAGAAAFPPLLGAFVDVQFQTAPWGLFIGALIGLIGTGLQLRRLQQEFPS